MQYRHARPSVIVLVLMTSVFVGVLSTVDDIFGFYLFAAESLWADIILSFLRLFSTPLPFVSLTVLAGVVSHSWKQAVVVGCLTQILALVPYYLIEALSGYRPAGSGNQLLIQALLWLVAGICLSLTISPLACHSRNNHGLTGQAGTGLICGVVIGSILPALGSRFEWTYSLFPWAIALVMAGFMLSRLRYSHWLALLLPCLVSIGIAFYGLHLIGMIGYGY